mgnify:CR=1 FL=1
MVNLSYQIALPEKVVVFGVKDLAELSKFYDSQGDMFDDGTIPCFCGD